MTPHEQLVMIRAVIAAILEAGDRACDVSANVADPAYYVSRAAALILESKGYK